MIKKYVKNYEKYSILISILMIILSIFLILKPLKSLEVFVIAFSIIMLINGISSFISYFQIDKEERLFSFDLIIGLITIISGIFIFIYRLDLINIFPIILGIWIIVNNLFKIQLSINLSVIKNSGWVYLVILSILMIVLGILLITNPFSSAVTITALSGIFLLISEIISLCESIYVLSKIKKYDKNSIDKTIKDNS